MDFLSCHVMYSWLDQKQPQKNCHQTTTQQFGNKSGSCVSALWLHQKPETTLVNHLHGNCELYVVYVQENPDIIEIEHSI